MMSCADPADPPPVPGPPDLPRWSEAPWVAWTGPSTPTSRPLAVFVDLPGGPMDQIAADPDVATFLNDRFHPWFLVPEVVDGLSSPPLPSPPLALILDAGGCVRTAPFRPADAHAWIEAANAALLAMAAGEPGTERLPPLKLGFALPEAHPLWGRCAGAAKESD